MKWLLAHSRQFLGLALCFLFVGCLVYGATFSASNQKCQTERAADYADSHKPGFGEKVASFFVCQGVTIDENGELLTALGTIAIAAFTLTLWLVTGKALKLGQDVFLASHRPKIRIRAVGFSGEPDDINNFQIALTCVNIGETKCEILSVRYQVAAIKFADRPNRTAGGFKQMGMVSPIILDPGEPESFASESLHLPEECAEDGFDIFGFVHYVDKRGVKRLSGFWSRYDPATEGFSAPKNPDWNYEY